MADRAKRVPEFFSTAVRKVEPVGGDVVRVYYSLERNGTWDDQFTVLMPVASIITARVFVTQSAREIAAETAAMANTTHKDGRRFMTGGLHHSCPQMPRGTNARAPG